jgi:hypothetical protein
MVTGELLVCRNVRENGEEEFVREFKNWENGM